MLDDPGVPESIKELRDKLALNIPELYNFHAKLIFLRSEFLKKIRDFHVIINKYKFVSQFFHSFNSS